MTTTTTLPGGYSTFHLERRKDRGGNFSGYTIALGAVEAYSKRERGAVKVGVRVVYGGGSGVRVVANDDLPFGVDERFAVEQLARHLAGPWIADIVRGVSAV